jgi:NAD(P)-dependent dehydrogenase (short-subunit alcohol dehydrogenase family)
LRDQAPRIRKRGAEIAVVGNGTRNFAEGFRDDMQVDWPILVDPELRAYRAAGLRRGRVEILSPRLPLHAVRALWEGHRQEGIQGDPWQLGGVFVLRKGGELVYQYRSREAGDHPPVRDILAALRAKAPIVSEVEPMSRLQKVVGHTVSLLVDPTIVLSFSRPGFSIHSLSFDPADLDVDLSSRRCLITGSNQGVGYEAALGLADLGAEVVLLCRSAQRGGEAAERIRERTGNARVRAVALDVSDLRAIRETAAELAQAPVDVLVHNAGLLPDRRTLTKDGLELTMATHVVGPHLLTEMLVPALPKGARVIWVSSGGMYAQKLSLDDWNWEKRPYDGVQAYAQTKRMQVVLSELWAERLARSGVRVNSMHPGWADTSGVRTSIPRFHRLTKSILRSATEGADTIVWLAASPAPQKLSGKFFLDRTQRATHYLPFTTEVEADRRALWELCEELIGTPGDGDAGDRGRTKTGHG